MADPTTELVKEFLEFNNYCVRKETKFQNNKKLQGTASDIDIIATRPTSKRIREIEFGENIIGEVKNYNLDKKDELDSIYKDKFQFLDKCPNESWKQLKKWIWTKKYDRAIFCAATTENIFDYALTKYNIKIISAGFMIKDLATIYKESKGKRTYYPESYNYSLIITIMRYLFKSHLWKDKLTLEDLVWIDPDAEPRYRNNFVKINSKIIENLVYCQSDWDIFGKLIVRATKEDPNLLKNICDKINNFGRA